MFSRKPIKTQKKAKVAVGTVLMAQPFWQDEKYKRSVILILENDSGGSKGIILNKPSTLIVSDALLDLEVSLSLYFGGQSNSQLITYLHSYAEVPDSFDLGNGLYFGGNYDYLVSMLDSRRINLRKIKFYSGFVRWTAGELESEIEENKWWTSEITADEFFSSPSEELWTNELLNNGHMYGLLNEFPDPCMS
jgi:putative transcriptional regulator